MLLRQGDSYGRIIDRSAFCLCPRRHTSIHVVVAVEETAAEASRTEGEFYQNDHLQYATPPVWTEKLRDRLATRLGDNVW